MIDDNKLFLMGGFPATVFFSDYLISDKVSLKRPSHNREVESTVNETTTKLSRSLSLLGPKRISAMQEEVLYSKHCLNLPTSLNDYTSAVDLLNASDEAKCIVSYDMPFFICDVNAEWERNFEKSVDMVKNKSLFVVITDRVLASEMRDVDTIIGGLVDSRKSYFSGVEYRRVVHNESGTVSFPVARMNGELIRNDDGDLFWVITFSA